MKLPLSIFIRTMILSVAAILLLSACSNEFAAKVRKVTYPPDFKYVSGQELRSNMHNLAYQLQLLDKALANTDSGQAAQQQVMDRLFKIEQAAASLQAGAAGASHPFLQDFMRNFVNQVGEARVAASLEPPRYYLAGKVSGGCVNCHKVNR